MTSALARFDERPVRPEPPPGPYLVAGVGRAGLAAAAALERLEGAARVKAWDGVVSPITRQARAVLSARGIETALGGDGTEMLSRDPPPACVVKSPGIPLDSELIALAARRALVVVDELELGWRLGRAPLVAVTGTNGKSTTASLVLAALEAASVTGVLAGNTEFGSPLSGVPSDARCVVCEVSSYQLEGCPELLPEVAVLTNVTRDHLHRHGTMERYGELKRRLFVRDGRASPLAVVNIDQAYGRALAGAVEKAGGRAVRYGARREADYRLESCSWDLRSSSARIRTPRGVLTVETRHPGPHNAANVTAAVALAGALEIDPEATVDRVPAACPMPGRFEPIDQGQPFDVVVDYAHTPDALRQVMLTARRIVSERRGARLHAVVSTPGTHDPPKRPEMGRIARSLADELVITTGSLYGEAPESVVDGLLSGARGVKGAALTVALDRRVAIERALGGARERDLVLVAGRGALPRIRLDLSGAGPEFDDRAVVRGLLSRRWPGDGDGPAGGAGRRSSGRPRRRQRRATAKGATDRRNRREGGRGRTGREGGPGRGAGP
jgi:UDP-N-acetylmuramoyl-L-alanyl-D-glutamate--2,6-diaminopimelate ligase